ncbi:hypothetical protein IAE22_31705, partial [Bacillus sp. S34]|nr:hypothetical protein [Bacillus sp. S34]
AGLARQIDSAFGDGFSLEARLPAGTSAPAGWAVTSDDPNPDDLVTAQILVDPTPGDLVTANRRAAYWVVVRTGSATPPWSSPRYRAGADRVVDLARPFADSDAEPPAIDGVTATPTVREGDAVIVTASVANSGDRAG